MVFMIVAHCMKGLTALPPTNRDTVITPLLSFVGSSSPSYIAISRFVRLIIPPPALCPGWARRWPEFTQSCNQLNHTLTAALFGGDSTLAE